MARRRCSNLKLNRRPANPSKALPKLSGAGHTSQSDAEPGYWHTDAPENSGVRAGYVELYFRTSKRLFVLKFPGGEHRIFHLHLPANPMRPKYRVWSEWQNPDFVAKAGAQPPRPSGGSDYQIRYKLDYQDR